MSFERRCLEGHDWVPVNVRWMDGQPAHMSIWACKRCHLAVDDITGREGTWMPAVGE